MSPREVHASIARGELNPPMLAWGSAQVGVVTLADEEPSRTKAGKPGTTPWCRV